MINQIPGEKGIKIPKTPNIMRMKEINNAEAETQAETLFANQKIKPGVEEVLSLVFEVTTSTGDKGVVAMLMPRSARI